jgi:trk system potassium uptake protein TrkA
LLARLFTEQFAFSKGDSIVVIGLGRFGGAVAKSLMQLGHDVMGIDRHAEPVHEWADLLTHAVQADSTNAMTMRQLGVADFAHAIVGIGTDLAASLMTVMALTELEIPDIWVKAMTPEHGRIAQRIGAHHVVYPEADMGERVAHLISGRMMDYIEFDDGFAIARIHAPTSTCDMSLAESGVRERFGVTVVGVKRANEDFQHATPETRILPGDLLIVSGPTPKVEGFAGNRRGR